MCSAAKPSSASHQPSPAHVTDRAWQDLQLSRARPRCCWTHTPTATPAAGAVAATTSRGKTSRDAVQRLAAALLGPLQQVVAGLRVALVDVVVVGN
eukprot:scaffold77443_cov18-Tisochrysis_lutea.AAC.4